MNQKFEKINVIEQNECNSILENNNFKNKLKIIYPDKTSLYGLGEITQKDQIYDLQYTSKEKMKISKVLDIGANIGLTAIWAKSNFPNSKICSIEPGRELIPFLTSNTLSFTNDIKIKNKAVVLNGPKEIKYFFSDEHSGSSTTNEEMVLEKHTNSYLVKTVSIIKEIKKFFRHSNKENNLMKIDIEGGEDEFILNEKFLKVLSKYVGWFMIEFHGDPYKQFDQLLIIMKYIKLSNISFEIQFTGDYKKQNLKNIKKPFNFEIDIEKDVKEVITNNFK